MADGPDITGRMARASPGMVSLSPVLQLGQGASLREHDDALSAPLGHFVQNPAELANFLVR